MYDFAYHRPETIGEAQRLFGQCEDPVFLAGGQTLIPTLKQRLRRPSDVIDLARVAGLRGIARDADALAIGAMATHGEIANSPEVRSLIPALAALAGAIGDPQVRSCGTLGGALANADPAADYPAAALALGATMHTATRRIAADDFFTGLFETALAPGELILKVDFPALRRAAYRKFRHPASRYAIVGVFVAETAAGVRVAVTGAGPCAFRQREMEAALNASFTPGAIGGIAVSDDGLNSDLQATPTYRAHLIGVMAARAVAAIAGPTEAP